MLARATQWIHANHLSGNAIPVTHRNRKPYPEVTGYYIPTLLAIGEIKLAEQFALWLATVQNPDGSFSLDDPNVSYVFDTGQVIRGWVSILPRLPQLESNLRRACQWILQGADPSTGRLLCPAPNGAWSLGQRGEVNEGIHLYVLKPLYEASDLLNEPMFKQAGKKALDYYLKNLSLTDFSKPNALTHFYAYIQEALFELECFNQVRHGMSTVAVYQQANGAIPAYADVNWICSTGLAQLAKVWYFLGETERADKAVEFFSQLQNGSGGFYGSYGPGANYFPVDEISWAVKYAIDVEQLRIANHFDQTVHQYTDAISAQDDRAQMILSALLNKNRILDAGCGKGRYASLIKQMAPALDVHAVDVSDEMLKHVPKTIQAKNANIQNLPYSNGFFDLVYCIEALEHAPNPIMALTEMVRVLAPGGTLIIIDKNLACKGALQTESWERWFDIEALTVAMQNLGLSVVSRYLGYDGKQADGLFVAWTGVKPQQSFAKKDLAGDVRDFV